MTCLREIVLGLAVIALLAPQRLSAQTRPELLERGIRAYEQLDLDVAAALLRRAAERGTGDSLGTPDRARALFYLGATQLLHRRRDATVAAFRQLVVLHPAFRPDDTRFPPEVTGLFDEVRLRTKVVAVDVPPVTEFRAGTEYFAARLLASSPHPVTASVVVRGGTQARALYDGPIVDTLVVTWDGLAAPGGAVAPGDYVLRVTSRTDAGGAERVVEVPLTLEQLPLDGVSAPGFQGGGAFSHGRPAMRSLAAGLLAGAAALALPSLVARNGEGSPSRLVVAGAISISGVVGFLTGRSDGTVSDDLGPLEEQPGQTGVRLMVRTRAAIARGPVTP